MIPALIPLERLVRRKAERIKVLTFALVTLFLFYAIVARELERRSSLGTRIKINISRSRCVISSSPRKIMSNVSASSLAM